MSKFRNPGDFRGAHLFQDSEIYNAPVFKELNLRSRPVPSPTAEELRAALECFASLPLDEIPVPAALPTGSQLSVRHNRLFVGRSQDLRRLAAIFKQREVVAVTGLGGLGKTQLAAEFAHRYGQYFAGGVFWLNCIKAEDVPGQVAHCGRGLALHDDFDALPQLQQLQLVQQVWSNPLPRLLILDNCEERTVLEQWRPNTGGAHMLITSRKADWPLALEVQMLKLGTLTPAQSLALLQQHRPELAADDPALAEIAATLGHLPLALHLAGSYLERYRYAAKGQPAAYLAELQRSELTHQSLMTTDGEYSPTGHELHVAHTFALSWEQLDPNNPIDELTRRALLRASCFAAGEAIPRELLKASLGVTAETTELDQQVEDTLRRALGLGLLEERAKGALVLHRLLGAFIRRMAQGELSSALDAVEQTVQQAAGRLNQEGYPAPLTLWRPHLRAVAGAAATRGSAQAGALLNELGRHLEKVAEFVEARAALERALAIDEKVYGPEHPQVAASVNNLGMVLKELGELAEARKAFERALAIDEKAYPPEHPQVATFMNNLGLVLKELGELAEARKVLERALAIDEKAYPPEHPQVATFMNNLGLVLKELGELAEARKVLERALTIDEKVYGLKHPNVARDVNNLGLVLQDLGELAGARVAYERALAIDEKVYGPEHPSVATDVNNLGMVLKELGELAEARKVLEQALAIFKASLPANHPSIRTVQNNLNSLKTA
jgi:tetratricopeptide (TPR) repeat protein